MLDKMKSNLNYSVLDRWMGVGSGQVCRAYVQPLNINAQSADEGGTNINSVSNFLSKNIALGTSRRISWSR